MESFLGSDPRMKGSMQVATTRSGQTPILNPGSKGPNILTNRPLERSNLTIKDITIESDFKFRIDRKLAETLQIPTSEPVAWVTYREFTLAMFKLHKKLKNFYDKPTQTFDLSQYVTFRRWWPNHQRIGCDEIKTFLLNGGGISMT